MASCGASHYGVMLSPGYNRTYVLSRTKNRQGLGVGTTPLSPSPFSPRKRRKRGDPLNNVGGLNGTGFKVAPYPEIHPISHQVDIDHAG
jgi:hypothetical protein